MISNSVITAMMINVGISVLAMVVPFGMIWFVSRKKEEGAWASLGLGVLGQFWSQYLILIPVIAVFTMFNWFNNLAKSHTYYLVYAVLTSLIFAVFSVLGMVWGVWLMNKRTPSLYRALCTGIGFAGITVASQIFSYYNYVKYCKSINAVGLEQFKDNLLKNSNTLDEKSVDNLIKQLKNANILTINIDSMNIIFLLAVEVALVTIIYEGLIRKQIWKAAALAAGIDFVYVLFGTIIGAMSTEKMGHVVSKYTGNLINGGYMLVCGLISIWFIYGAVCRYKIVLKEGPYAHYAYFEKEDKEA